MNKIRTGDHWSALFPLCQHCLRQREKQFSENHMATYPNNHFQKKHTKILKNYISKKQISN